MVNYTRESLFLRYVTVQVLSMWCLGRVCKRGDFSTSQGMRQGRAAFTIVKRQMYKCLQQRHLLPDAMPCVQSRLSALPEAAVWDPAFHTLLVGSSFHHLKLTSQGRYLADYSRTLLCNGPPGWTCWAGERSHCLTVFSPLKTAERLEQSSAASTKQGGLGRDCVRHIGNRLPSFNTNQR